eukprot:TRINITY_DN10269_c0_g1_i1.p1 TRINITY_DN10269_c0_g1~~TRINITY_DN10269_c0_g1_i1.p1  ORF type:complete len:232 (+),score=22.06 TRINITY_DN10269_c0_g1_i1:278-973(+)
MNNLSVCLCLLSTALTLVGLLWFDGSYANWWGAKVALEEKIMDVHVADTPHYPNANFVQYVDAKIDISAHLSPIAESLCVTPILSTEHHPKESLPIFVFAGCFDLCANCIPTWNSTSIIAGPIYNSKYPNFEATFLSSFQDVVARICQTHHVFNCTPSAIPPPIMLIDSKYWDNLQFKQNGDRDSMILSAVVVPVGWLILALLSALVCYCRTPAPINKDVALMPLRPGTGG